MMHRFLLLISLILPMWTLKAQDDVQYWSQYDPTIYKDGGFRLSFYMEGRFDRDVSDQLGAFFGPRLHYKINKNWSSMFAAKYIFFRVGEDMNEWQRTEVELTYKTTLGSARLDVRNRHEYIFRDPQDDIQRLRQRWRLTWNLDHPVFTKFFAHNEFFWREDAVRDYDFSRNRFTPLGVGIKFNKRVNLSVYYMIEHRSGRDGDNHNLGTFLVW